MENKRNISLDIIKGLGILLVVYGHAARGIMESNTSSNVPFLKTLDFLIYTTHMPLFFLIAGYHAYLAVTRKPPAGYLKSRGWAIVYPYFFWSVALVMIKYLSGIFIKIHDPIDWHQLISLAWQPIAIFWFLYSLLILQLLLVASIKRLNLFYLLVGAMLLGVFGAAEFFPKIIVITAVHAPFFAIGCFVASRKKEMTDSFFDNSLVLAALVLAFSICGYLALQLNLQPPVGLLTLPLSCMGIALLISLGMRLSHTPLANGFALLGRYSFPIYLMHVIPISLIPRVFDKLHIHSDAATLAAQTVIGLYGSLVVFKALQKCGLDGWFALSGKAPVATHSTKKAA